MKNKMIRLYGLESSDHFELKDVTPNFAKDYVEKARTIAKDEGPWVYVDFFEKPISRIRGHSRIIYIGKTQGPFKRRYNSRFIKDFDNPENSTFYRREPFKQGGKYAVYFFAPPRGEAFNVWKESYALSERSKKNESWLESLFLGLYFMNHSELPPKNFAWNFREPVLNFLKQEKHGFDSIEANPFEDV